VLSSTETGTFLFLGGASGPSSTFTSLTVPGGTSNEYGAPIAGAGDVDGDGFDDVLVGTPYADDYEGAVYFFAGGAAGLAMTPLPLVIPIGPPSYFGSWLASVALPRPLRMRVPT